MNTSQNELSYGDKLVRLQRGLGRLESLAVAFSGGVDSSVLLHAGFAALGDSCVAVIADSPSLPRAELAEAQQVAAAIGARLVTVTTRELEDPRYVANGGDRCYFCKSALFDLMGAWVRQNGLGNMAFGEITDDLSDDRPGARAAQENAVLAPLRSAGFSKRDVRRYAREAGLEVADKPASACLASRMPRGTEVTRERLAQVESAESALHRRGYRVVRVRHHGSRALVEFGELEFETARAELLSIQQLLEPLGYERVDLGIYLSPAQRLRSAT